MNDKPKTGGEVWNKAIEQGMKEKPKAHEITDDRPAIRAALRESRRRHTVRVRSCLP